MFISPVFCLLDKCLLFTLCVSVPALFSQVAILAAVLALVVIVIMSLIILIAVWRKVKWTNVISASLPFSVIT